MLVIMESNIYGGDNKYKDEETFTLYLVLIVIAKNFTNPGGLALVVLAAA